MQFANTDSFDEAQKYIYGDIRKQKLEKVLNDIELPLIPVIEKMETRGVKIDSDCLKKLSFNYHKKLSVIEKKIYKHAGAEFNINSPKTG